MSDKLTRSAYQKLVNDDLAWLESLPQSVWRDHVMQVVKASPNLEYPSDPEARGVVCAECGRMSRVTTVGCDHCDWRPCWCADCEDARCVGLSFAEQTLHRKFIVCSMCGNKRCPRAKNHDNACTNSNEPGQPGSGYP